MRRGLCEHGIDAASCRLVECSSNRLTDRERRAVELTAKGMTNGEIASEMGVTLTAAREYLRRANLKTGSDNRTELAMWWRDRQEAPALPTPPPAPAPAILARDDRPMRLVTYLLAALVLVLAWRRS